LSGYSKRKKLTLTGGASGAQTDFQLKLAITFDSDMQADFDDIRFTKSDGETLIDAWLESKIDSTSAVVWVEFPTTPANTVDQTYYMYYGNGSAASDWDGSATFLKFDDFDDGSISDWSGQTASFEASTDKSYDGSYSLKKTGAAGHGNAYLHQAETTSDIEVQLRVWNSDSLNKRGGVFIGVSGDADHYYTLYCDPDSVLHLYEFNNGSIVGSVANDVMGSIPSDQWCKYIIRKVGTTWDIYVYLSNDSLIGSVTGATIDITPGYVGVHFYDTTMYGDHFIARKYASNPPTYAFGSEEAVAGNPFWYYNMLKRRNS